MHRKQKTQKQNKFGKRKDDGKNSAINGKSNNIPLTALILFPIICFATNAAIFNGFVFKLRA